MATIHWKSVINGLFGKAADWNPSQIPQAGDDVLIDAAGAYTVASSTDHTINTIGIVSTATLAVKGGTFTITNGTGTGENAGTIRVADGATLAIGGTFTNSGNIVLNSAGDQTDLIIQKDTTLANGSDGGGTVKLSAGGHNIIKGNGTAATLTISGNTIEGAGAIGGGDLTLAISSGTIDGDSTKAVLKLNTGDHEIINATSGVIEGTTARGLIIVSDVSNAGTIEAFGTDARLRIDGAIANAGGLVAASGDGAHVGLASATINDGTMQIANNSIVETVGGSGLSVISHVNVLNSGTLEANEGSTLSITNSNIGTNGTLMSNGYGSLLSIDGTVGAVSGTINGGEIEFKGPSAANITFTPNTAGTLKLDTSTFTGHITGFAPAASQTGFSDFFAFGHSDIDSGWFPTAIANGDTNNEPGAGERSLIAAAVANGGTGAPVGFGLMNSQILAHDFGWTATPADATGGGSNFAIAGAMTAEDAGGTVYTNTPDDPGNNVTDPGNGSIGNVNSAHLPSTVQQIENYLSANGDNADPSALYLIETGGNDIKYAKANITGGANQQAYLIHQADALAAEIEVLQNAGAQTIVVHGFGGDNGDPATNYEALFDSELFGDLKANNVNFVESDLSTMNAAILANPSKFGLTTTGFGTPKTSDTASAFIDFETKTTTDSGWGQWGAPTGIFSTNYAFLRTPNAEYTSLYSDDQHFSTQGQQIEADFDLSLLFAAGAAAMDAIDLKNIDYAFGTTTATFAGTTAGGILTVTDGTHTAELSLTGEYTAANFVTADDGKGGTAVIEAAPSTSAQTDITSSHLLDAHYGGAIVAGMNYAVVDFTLTESVTLKGDTGGVVLSSADDILTDGSATTLTNHETIHGGGTIGDGFMTLVNGNTGIIDADNPTNGMTIHTPDHAVSNGGTIEATAGGWLLISDTTITDSANAHFSASGTNSLVELDNATVSGGIVSVGADAYMQTVHGGTSTINAPVSNNGTLGAFNGSTLLVNGAVTGTGAAQVGLSGIMVFASASNDSFTFATVGTDHTGTLMLDKATSTTSQFTGAISGFDVGDDIYLGAIHAAGASVHAGAFTGGTTTVTVSDGTAQIALSFEGDYHTNPFDIHSVNGYVDLLLV